MTDQDNDVAELRELIAAMQSDMHIERAKTEAKIAALEAMLAQAPAVEPTGASTPATGDHDDPAAPMVRSRRDLLKKAGLGAAATAAGVVAMSQPAAAADGDSIVLGDETNTASTPTVVTALGSGRNAVTFEDAPGFYGSSTTYESTLAAYSASGLPNAFFAYAENGADASSTTTGHAMVAWASAGSRSNILLRSSLPDPTTSSMAHRHGELVFDTRKNLWMCVDAGTPGTWRKIAGPDTAGSMHVIAPKRVWDTRFQGGAMSNGESRTVSIKDGRVLSSPSIDVPNLVPAGATAVAFNLAVVNTGPGGFLSVTPGDASAFGAASINWASTNSILNNGTMSTVDSNRDVTVWCTGTTDFIIDITGYYL